MRQQVKMRVVPWWLILLQGIALIIIGILFLTNPASTALGVVTVLGIYWLISGILGIIGIFLNSHNWFWKLLMGILGIVAGVLILQHPITATLVVGASLVLWLGLLGIMIGIVQIIRGVTGEGWGALILGIVSVILGIILLSNFWGVAISLPWSLGILSLIGGAVAIWHAFGARRIQQDMAAGTDEMTNQAKAAAAAADAKVAAAASNVRSTTVNAGAAGSSAATGVAAGVAGVAAAASRAADSAGDKAEDAVDAVGDAAGDAMDAVGDVADDAMDTAGDAMDTIGDAAGDAVDAVGDMAGDAMDAVSDTTSRSYNIPAAVGALTAEDKLALSSWADDKGITQTDIDRLMASPYGDLLARGKTPQERAALARELGVEEKKILFYLNMADLQRINGVGAIYAYLLEASGVDTVKELATRNSANLTAKMGEVNAVRAITKRVPPEGEVANWVAEAKTMAPGLEY